VVAPTVTVAVAETGPLNPCAVAVMVAVPLATPVTTPVALTVATDVVFDDQVTPLDTGCVER